MSQPERGTFYPCPKECDKDLPITPHEVLDLDVVRVKCLNCNHVHELDFRAWLRDQQVTRTPRRQAHLTKYPRVEPHTGEVVTSKDHEKETVKRMGFYEGHHGGRHGVDRGYDS